jgi:uncharacterized protein YjbI with pentapeptide repeats
MLRPPPSLTDGCLATRDLQVRLVIDAVQSAEISDMDRDEALELLRAGERGVAEWNRRRRAGEKIPDLSRANLHGVDLRGAWLHLTTLNGANLSQGDLSGCDLRRVDLGGANLSGAKLSGADLGWAKLSGADLVEASLFRANVSFADLSTAILLGSNLSGANLTGADLNQANLSGALLFIANFSGAKFSGADLSGAYCASTVFADVDLSEVKGLDSVAHNGPSTLGIETLFRSKWKIPEAFLRGSGVPQYLIENQKALISSMEPIQFCSCFISHSSSDQAFAQHLHSRMVREKLRVWYAPDDMRGGRKNVDQIDEAIRVHDKLLVVLSTASMASDWVIHEITQAVEREKREKGHVLFPIGLSPRDEIKAWSAFDSDMGKDVAKAVREYHIPDFSNWKDPDAFEKAFAHLLRDLEASDAE